MNFKNELLLFERTDQGNRENNEDYLTHLIQPEWAFFMVADGLGGHPKGEEASRIFCECVKTAAPDYAKQIEQDPTQAMEALLLTAQLKFRQQVVEEFGQIDLHTTFVLAWLNEKQLITAHVGDSRIYRLDPQQVIWRTPDHSVVQDLYEQGVITEEEMSNHPLQNQLSNTIGIFNPPQPDIFLQPPLLPDESLILCTDGFWEHMNRQELVKMANSGEIEVAIDRKIKNIIENNQHADNITLQIVKCRARARLTQPPTPAA